MIPELLGVLELKPKLQFDPVVASPGSGGGSIAHRDVVLILGLTSRSAGKVEPLLSDPRFQRLHIKPLNGPFRVTHRPCHVSRTSKCLGIGGVAVPQAVFRPPDSHLLAELAPEALENTPRNLNHWAVTSKRRQQLDRGRFQRHIP